MMLNKVLKSVVFIFISFVNIFFICSIFQDSFRIGILFQKYVLEIIFLLITGVFLYSFNYRIMGIPISFNAFIIYVSNNILKSFNIKGIEIVYLFVIIYFFTLFIYNFISFFLNHKIQFSSVLIIVENMLASILMWSILITVYNTLSVFFKININYLKVIDVILLLIIILVHQIIKTFFTYLSFLIEGKYYSFSYHTAPYLIIDSIFIYFSLILGSVYHSIGILNTALFIIFLAISFSFTKFVSKHQDILFYSIHTFLNPNDTKQKLFFVSESPRGFNEEVDIDKEIKCLFFVVIDLHEVIPQQYEFDSRFLKNTDRFFLLRNRFFCTAVAHQEKIGNYKIRIGKFVKKRVRLAYCVIDKKYFSCINVNYIFKILISRLKLNKNSSEEIIDVKQKYMIY